MRAATVRPAGVQVRHSSGARSRRGSGSMTSIRRADEGGAESDRATTSSRRTFLAGAGTALVGALVTVTTEGVAASGPAPHALDAGPGSASSGLSRTPLARGQVTRGAPM